MCLLYLTARTVHWCIPWRFSCAGKGTFLRVLIRFVDVRSLLVIGNSRRSVCMCRCVWVVCVCECASVCIRVCLSVNVISKNLITCCCGYVSIRMFFDRIVDWLPLMFCFCISNFLYCSLVKYCAAIVSILFEIFYNVYRIHKIE